MINAPKNRLPLKEMDSTPLFSLTEKRTEKFIHPFKEKSKLFGFLGKKCDG